MLLVAACSPAASTPSPTPLADDLEIPLAADTFEPGEPTAWEQVLARVAERGSPTLTDALDAFAVAFAPLPGTEQPAGEIVRLEDGTLAVRWIRRFWEQLTPEQQAYADSLIRGEVPAAMLAHLAVAGPAAPPIVERQPPADVNDWKSLGTQARADLLNRLGRDVKATVTVIPLTTMIDVPSEDDLWDAGGWADAKDAAGEWTGPQATCDIYIHPDSLAFSALDARFLATHEMFHCFESDLGPLGEQGEVPEWVTEGAADYAGLSITLGQAYNPDAKWLKWLIDPPRPLYSRAYDAHAIYYLLQNAGADPWAVMDQHLMAARAGTEAAYAVLWQTGGDAFLNTWGSRYVMYPGKYPNWRYVADGLTLEGLFFIPPTYPIEAGSSFEETADAYAANLMFAKLLADVVVLDTLGGHGLVLTKAGEFSLEEAASLPFCTVPGGCVCPDGTPGAGTEFRNVPHGSMLWAGLTGHLTGVGLTIIGLDLGEFCDPEPKTPEPSGDAPEPGCDDTCPGSNGDPHIVTIDGYRYDFQAAGEFTLLRGPDGVEIQARQEPYGQLSSVSVNTAVAVGLDGARVAVYGRGLDLQVRVNGAEVALDEEVSAGQLVVRLGAEGVEIQAPDGTLVWVLGQSRWGLNVVVDPSDELEASGSGILGRLNGELLPRLPDGSMVDATADYRAALYGPFADAWAVTDTNTLFDYEAGAGPATYRDTAFPDPNAPLDFSQLTSEQQQAGLATCAAVTNLILREQCAFDVVVSGDPTFAEPYLATNELHARRGGDACGLLTEDQIESITGLQMVEREPGTESTGNAGCTWRVDNGEGLIDPTTGESATFDIKLDLLSPGGRAAFEDELVVFEAIGYVDVPELAGRVDRAMTGTGQFEPIVAFRGDTRIVVDYINPFSDDNPAVRLQLFQLILDRL